MSMLDLLGGFKGVEAWHIYIEDEDVRPKSSGGGEHFGTSGDNRNDGELRFEFPLACLGDKKMIVGDKDTGPGERFHMNPRGERKLVSKP